MHATVLARATAVAAGTMLLAVTPAATAQPPAMTTGTATFYVADGVGSLKVETKSSSGSVDYSVNGVTVFAGTVLDYQQSTEDGVDVATISGSTDTGGVFVVTIHDNAAGGSAAPPDHVTLLVDGEPAADAYILDGNFTVH